MYVTLMVDGGGAIMDKNVLGIFTIFIMTPSVRLKIRKWYILVSARAKLLRFPELAIRLCLN
jgi:hypothetical protein